MRYQSFVHISLHPVVFSACFLFFEHFILEKKTKKKLVYVFDLHFFPKANQEAPQCQCTSKCGQLHFRHMCSCNVSRRTHPLSGGNYFDEIVVSFESCLDKAKQRKWMTELVRSCSDKDFALAQGATRGQICWFSEWYRKMTPSPHTFCMRLAQGVRRQIFALKMERLAQDWGREASVSRGS